MTERTQPDAPTRAADRDPHTDAGRDPTPEEERLADENELDPSVAEHEEEMLERGAHQQGEGRLP